MPLLKVAVGCVLGVWLANFVRYIAVSDFLGPSSVVLVLARLISVDGGCLRHAAAGDGSRGSIVEIEHEATILTGRYGFVIELRSSID